MEAGVSVAGDGGVVVRAAVADDLAAIAEIEAATFSRPWSRDAFAALLDRAEVAVLVATGGGEVVGYVVVVIGADEAELANLAVSARRRGKGVGDALLARASEVLRTRGVGWAYLAVRESNHRAMGLYRRHGFNEIGRHASYYRDPSEDALIFARDLTT